MAWTREQIKAGQMPMFLSGVAAHTMLQQMAYRREADARQARWEGKVPENRSVKPWTGASQPSPGLAASLEQAKINPAIRAAVAQFEGRLPEPSRRALERDLQADLAGSRGLPIDLADRARHRVESGAYPAVIPNEAVFRAVATAVQIGIVAPEWAATVAGMVQEKEHQYTTPEMRNMEVGRAVERYKFLQAGSVDATVEPPAAPPPAPTPQPQPQPTRPAASGEQLLTRGGRHAARK
jgi:hypothetical protein